MHKVNEIMTDRDYLQIFQLHLKSTALWFKFGHSFVLQQQSNPKHTSKLVVEFKKQANIKLLERPSQSPDLNTMLKSWVHARKPISLNKLKHNPDKDKQKMMYVWIVEKGKI